MELISRETVVSILERHAYDGLDYKKPINSQQEPPLIIRCLKEIRNVPAMRMPMLIRCRECAHKKEENGTLCCPYSTVDLKPNGFCDHGIIKSMYNMQQRIEENERRKKIYAEEDWGESE